MAMFSREHTSAAGTTFGIGYKAVGEAYAFVGDTVNVGGFDVALIVSADGLVRVVIAHDEEDVHRLFGNCCLLLLVTSCTGSKAR